MTEGLKPLNRKDGTLRGADIVFFGEELDDISSPSKGLVGWPVSGGKFVINYERVDGDKFEISLTQAAVERILESIQDYIDNQLLRETRLKFGGGITSFDWSDYTIVNTTGV